MSNLKLNLSRSRQIKGKKKSKFNFLLVCEGSKTEPNYFNWLCARWKISAEVKIIGGSGNTVSVVEAAIKERDTTSIKYDQIWAIFDHDSFPKSRINRAFELAKSQKINIAFSNESFELWYLLHYNYHQTSISRHALCQNLTNILNTPYDKSSCDIIESIYPKLKNALHNSENLYKLTGKTKANPYTNVHKLVLSLAKNASKLPLCQKEIRDLIN